MGNREAVGEGFSRGVLEAGEMLMRTTEHGDGFCCSAGASPAFFGAEDSAATESASTIFCNAQ